MLRSNKCIETFRKIPNRRYNLVNSLDALSMLKRWWYAALWTVHTWMRTDFSNFLKNGVQLLWFACCVNYYLWMKKFSLVDTACTMLHSLIKYHCALMV